MAYKALYLDDVRDFINDLSLSDAIKIKGATNALEQGEFNLVYVRQLKGDIKEIKVKKYRIIFFIYENNIFFIRIFVKKTNKTPKTEMQFAEKIYKFLTKK